MATPRIRIRNEGNRIQFMNGGIQFQLVDKGVVYTTTEQKYRVGNTGPSTILIPTPASYKTRVIAVRASFFVAKWGITDITGNGDYRAMYSCSTNQANQPVEYWVFDLATNLAGSGVGLKLRDPDTGQVIYNSNYDSLRIAGIVGDGGGTFTAGRKYAAILPAISGHNQTTDTLYRDGQAFLDDGQEYGYATWSRQVDGKLYGVKWENETCSFGEVSFDDVIGQTPGYAQQPDPPTVWWDNPLGNVIIADVTAL